jgi:hypothetical protein
MNRRIAAAFALAAALLPVVAGAQTPAAALRLSWDHCAGDGLVADRSFACDTNSGTDRLVTSVVVNDGERTGVMGLKARIDIRTTAQFLPPWWQVQSGQPRAGQIGFRTGDLAVGVSCPPWYESAGAGNPLPVFSISQGNESPNSMQLMLEAVLPSGDGATWSAGQEFALFEIVILHAKSTGSGSAAGCAVPTCIGFGYLGVLHVGQQLVTEEYLGTAASAVTWQGAYVAGYSPYFEYVFGGNYYLYRGNLACTTGPVPAQNRTWGVIKTLYR